MTMRDINEATARAAAMARSAGDVTLTGVATEWGRFNQRRILVMLALFAALAAPGRLGEVTRGAVVDAYLQVSVFVAATLLIFYGVEKVFRVDIAEWMRRDKVVQIPVAAFFGALPGCGGAIFVVAAFSSGHVGMGAVVATLTATMGDAAYLLIATRPDAAMVVLPVSMFVGILTGYVVDYFDKKPIEKTGDLRHCDIAPRIRGPRWRDFAYLGLAAPGLVLGVMLLFQVDLETKYGAGPEILALTGIALGALIWAVSPVKAMTAQDDPAVTRMTEETSFVSIWVVAAYLAYEYFDAFVGVDLAALAQAAAPIVPLLAILIGFIPGCGPQVLVTTLYINGIIPFAALIGNAISNDGDALFPAIALNPRAAVLATAYSAVPAVIVAYLFYFFPVSSL